MVERFDAYEKAYLAAEEADRLYRLNHGQSPKGLLARLLERFCGDGPLSQVAFEREVPSPATWDWLQAEIEYRPVLEEMCRKEKEIRSRYEEMRVKARRQYLETLKEGGVWLKEMEKM